MQRTGLAQNISNTTYTRPFNIPSPQHAHATQHALPLHWQ